MPPPACSHELMVSTVISVPSSLLHTLIFELLDLLGLYI